MRYDSHTATLSVIDARVVCVQADDVIHVADELWREFEAGDDDRPGGPRIVDQVLTFGVPDAGEGRLSYRWVCFVPTAGVHVLERIR